MRRWLIALAACCVGPVLAEQLDTVAWRQMIETDWLRDAELRTSQPAGQVTTQDDAAGACDGIKDGKWAFHTSGNEVPWWQVDLGQSQPIARVLIWNRCDNGPERARNLTLQLSDDGKQWRPVYAHNGEMFYGFTDKKPLEIRLTDQSGRFVRVQLPDKGFLYLDEVEVFSPADPAKNLALHRPADQSSISQWSAFHHSAGPVDWPARVRDVLARCPQDAQSKRLSAMRDVDLGQSQYSEARWIQRRLDFANPLLDFEDILFVKRVPGSYSHMSDQYYGWWSRPGGGIFILKNFKSATPQLVCLTPQLTEGSCLRPELSYDGKRILFSFAKHYPTLAGDPNKTDKKHLPEDAFYHVFEMNVDGSGLRQITHGKYDDFSARYLPSGEIVFLSTRRGQFVQASKHCATETLQQVDLPDSYVRCGGGDSRPVAVYTLHVMIPDGGNLRPLSPFENFEWDPVVANDGRIMYARWDYVDRNNMPYMSLWSTNPDGTNPQLVYGNFTRNPHSVFEARPIPNSKKILFTASAHHSISGGSLALLDVDKGQEDSAPLKRLTPEVCFPEVEGWPQTWYAAPWPLSEDVCLTAWSPMPLNHEGSQNNAKALGLYLYAGGVREVIYRDPNICSSDPIPLRPRKVPPVISNDVAWDGPQEGRMLLLNVYDGLDGVKPGDVKSLRIVAVPAKTQPQMNSPVLGMTADDPGKCVLGTVAVERDGSAYFRVPSGVNLFFQALDTEGMAIQTMRTISYVQPGKTISCVGCHEHRYSSPPNAKALAALRAPSRIAVGPEGSWPLRFDKLVQPVLDKSCVSCHKDLNYEKLISFGKPSLRDHVKTRYGDGRSIAGQGAAATSTLLAYLKTDPHHADVKLDRDSLTRLVTWMDTYAQRLGSFSDEQERQLVQLRGNLAGLLEERR